MDGWQRIDGTSGYDQLRRIGERAVRLVGEPITFVASPDELRGLLGEPGFRVTEIATSAVLDQRFATGGRRCDEGLYVVAAERR
jgi:hypothetical protein